MIHLRLPDPFLTGLCLCNRRPEDHPPGKVLPAGIQLHRGPSLAVPDRFCCWGIFFPRKLILIPDPLLFRTKSPWSPSSGLRGGACTHLQSTTQRRPNPIQVALYIPAKAGIHVFKHWQNSALFHTPYICIATNTRDAYRSTYRIALMTPLVVPSWGYIL